MTKYLILAGIILIILCGGFLLLSYVVPFASHKIQPEKNLSPTASLSFFPTSLLTSCKNTTYSVPILLSASNTSLNGVQIELSYDPSIIYNVALYPAEDNFFGSSTNYSVTLDEVREQYGRASMALQLNPTQAELSGNKQVGILTFTINSQASTSSQIKFLNKSTASTSRSQDSLLSNTTPLTIYCQ